MGPIYVVGIVAVLVAAALWLWRSGAGAGRAVDEAVRKGDAEPILTAAARLPHARRSAFFQQAVSLLWDGYQRPLAIQVLKEFAKDHSSEKICQFWLRQAQEVEPLEAGKTLGKDFLKLHYRPEVAACCKKTSS